MNGERKDEHNSHSADGNNNRGLDHALNGIFVAHSLGEAMSGKIKACGVAQLGGACRPREVRGQAGEKVCLLDSDMRIIDWLCNVNVLLLCFFLSGFP